MNDPIVLLDPTAEEAPAVKPRRARPASLAGLTFGLALQTFIIVGGVELILE